MSVTEGLHRSFWLSGAVPLVPLLTIPLPPGPARPRTAAAAPVDGADAEEVRS
ncbi:hypothetical protein [Streptomyces zhaozhouensis]|uniref:hypothetical protein n=1 Tax=Streptomyces zhaozhouensis TaxID=1300267 RepID=UPI001BAEFD52|nr:hypothetical protein [Streptomyces zhaozhouensis]